MAARPPWPLLRRPMCCCSTEGEATEQQHVVAKELFSTDGRVDAAEALGGSQIDSPTASDSPNLFSAYTGRRAALVAAGAGGPGVGQAKSGAERTQDNERERARLRQLVKEFTNEAVDGISVVVVTYMTGQCTPYFLQMDRCLTVFSLHPKGCPAPDASTTFNLKDLTHIYAGAEVSTRAPWLGERATLCVGADTRRADRCLLFAFEDEAQRDRFYTCMRILRMSVDMGRARP